MIDIYNKEKRSEIMSRIRSENTKPEKRIRSFLHSEGWRFVLHDKRLPGSPDIVLPKYKSVVQVRGCFWHDHKCKLSSQPKTNIKFWKEKLKTNSERDKKNDQKLKRLGWKNIIVWECKTNTIKKFQKTKKTIIQKLINEKKN